jgi:hypothetical protein
VAIIARSKKQQGTSLSFILYHLAKLRFAPHYILAFSLSPAPVPLYLLFWALKV